MAPRGRRGVWATSLTVGACVVLSGMASAAPAGLYGGRAQSLRNRHAAYLDAPRVLAKLALPPGATLTRTVPRSELSALEAANNHADAGQLWSVPGTIDGTLSYVRQHPPSGATLVAVGSDNRPGQPQYDRWLRFAEPPIGDVIGDRYLFVLASSAGSGRTRVFAQAESIWISARKNSERIPAATDRIVVRITQADRHPRTITVTGHREVGLIVTAFNSVQTVQPDSYSCGMIFTPHTFTYTFLNGGRALARVTYTVVPGGSPWACAPMTVNIAGRQRAPLLGGPPIIGVQRRLGVRTISGSA